MRLRLNFYHLLTISPPHCQENAQHVYFVYSAYVYVLLNSMWCGLALATYDANAVLSCRSARSIKGGC